LERVDDIIVLADLTAQRAVGANERVQRVAEHLPGAPGHHFDLRNADAHLRLAGEPDS
jgi:hypothetical protein